MHIMDDIDEVINRVERKVLSPSFSRAVGKSITEDILLLIKALRESRCVVPLDLNDAERLLNNYYIAEHRVKDLMRRTIEVMLNKYGNRLREVYPLLPMELRDALRSAANTDDYLDRLVNSLINELRGPEQDLVMLVKTAREVSSKCGE